jgi:hypothetical protein
MAAWCSISPEAVQIIVSVGIGGRRQRAAPGLRQSPDIGLVWLATTDACSVWGWGSGSNRKREVEIPLYND